MDTFFTLPFFAVIHYPLVDLVPQHCTYLNARACAAEREGETERDRSRAIGAGGPLHLGGRGRSAECQLSDPAYCPMYAIRMQRTQEQYPDDYRVAGVA